MGDFGFNSDVSADVQSSASNDFLGTVGGAFGLSRSGSAPGPAVAYPATGDNGANGRGADWLQTLGDGAAKLASGIFSEQNLSAVFSRLIPPEAARFDRPIPAPTIPQAGPVNGMPAGVAPVLVYGGLGLLALVVVAKLIK